LEHNSERNGVAERIEGRVGDLFECVRIDEKFDLIVFNPPFTDGDPHTRLEEALLDKGHRTLCRFVGECGSHLKQDGRVLLAFSNAGDCDLLGRKVLEADLCARLRHELKSDLWFFVLELRPTTR
jgi:methylase of polypeptide subunit release factors